MSDMTVLMWEGPNYMQTTNEYQLELDLDSFEQEESGEYMCTATNERGSASLSVYVYGELKWT